MIEMLLQLVRESTPAPEISYTWDVCGNAGVMKHIATGSCTNVMPLHEAIDGGAE